jgi:hypothetical protein
MIPSWVLVMFHWVEFLFIYFHFLVLVGILRIFEASCFPADCHDVPLTRILTRDVYK